MTRCMGLDISKSVTGWAVFDGSSWRSGVLRCPARKPLGEPGISAKHVGAACHWYAMQLHQLLQDAAPTLVAIEQPLLPGDGVKAPLDAVHMSNALCATAAAAAARLSIPAVYAAAQAWRREFGVRSPTRADRVRVPRFDRTSWNKAEAVRVCGERGVDVRSLDEAQAVGIAWWAWRQMHPDQIAMEV